MSEPVILYDDDPAHRAGYKVVRLDLATGKLYTEPNGPDSHTVWQVGQCSLRNHRDQPMEMCRRAVHFCIEHPVGCYFFVVLADREGMLSTGKNGYIPSLHSAKLSSTSSLVVKAPESQHINLGNRLKRGCHELELGEPLTGSWFDLTDAEYPGLGVSTRNGLLHSYLISDEQIACLEPEDVEFLNRPEERGQWYMPSIDLMQDRLWRWHRDGQPIVGFNGHYDSEIDNKNWGHVFHRVRPRCKIPSYMIVLLHQRAFALSFGLGTGLSSEDSLRLHVMCRTWSASIIECVSLISDYISSFDKLFKGFWPCEAKMNGWLRTVCTAITLPYGSLDIQTTITVLSGFLATVGLGLLVRLFPLTLEPGSVLSEQDFSGLFRAQKLTFNNETWNRSLAAALESLSFEHLERLLSTVVYDQSTVRNEFSYRLRCYVDHDPPSFLDLSRSLVRAQLERTE